MELVTILSNQLEIESRKAAERLTQGNLETIYKLSETLYYLDRLRESHKPQETVNATMDYSNGRYEHNIDILYNDYITAKVEYRKTKNKEAIMESLKRLISEVYDMLHTMLHDSDFQEERDEIKLQVKRLTES